MTPTEQLVMRHWRRHRPNLTMVTAAQCTGAWKHIVVATDLPAERVIEITRRLDRDLAMFTWETDAAVQRVNRYQPRVGGIA